MCTVVNLFRNDEEKMPVAGAQDMVWEDPTTGKTFIIDNRTGNSHPQSARFTVGTDGQIEASAQRRTLPTPHLTVEEKNYDNNTDAGHIPNWLREALQVCLLLPHRVLDRIIETIERPTTPSRLKSQRYPPSPS